jgi:hypothetical protein
MPVFGVKVWRPRESGGNEVPPSQRVRFPKNRARYAGPRSARRAPHTMTEEARQRFRVGEVNRPKSRAAFGPALDG